MCRILFFPHLMYPRLILSIAPDVHTSRSPQSPIVHTTIDHTSSNHPFLWSTYHSSHSLLAFLGQNFFFHQQFPSFNRFTCVLPQFTTNQHLFITYTSKNKKNLAFIPSVGQPRLRLCTLPSRGTGRTEYTQTTFYGVKNIYYS